LADLFAVAFHGSVFCSERRVIIREHHDSYGYAPRRERYIERRGYGDGGGIGIRAPGVSVGIGTDRY
jgi:hypothetical protein